MAHNRRPKSRHTSLALYVLIRGITLLVRCGNKPDADPRLRRHAPSMTWRWLSRNGRALLAVSRVVDALILP